MAIPLSLSKCHSGLTSILLIRLIHAPSLLRHSCESNPIHQKESFSIHVSVIRRLAYQGCS